MSINAEPVGAQGRWDATFAKLDRSCPARRADEVREVDYLRRLARIGRKYVPSGEKIAQVSFAQLPDSVVPQYAELMREAVERNLFRTDNMRPGEMRPVMIVDKNTGMKQRHFVGPDSFVKDMGRPCRRVVSIKGGDTILYQSADSRQWR